jgi:hypothetical protein
LLDRHLPKDKWFSIVYWRPATRLFGRENR